MIKIKLRNTLVTVLIAVVMVAGYLFIRSLDKKAENIDRAGTAPTWESYIPEDITYNGVTYSYNRDLTTIMLMGIDVAGPVKESEVYYNNGQSDFIMLAVFDNVKKSYTLLHVNRDTMCDVTILGLNGAVVGHATEQLALSHAYGNGLAQSCDNTVRALTKFLGVPVHYYAAMNMDGVARAADLVGGVTVTVKDDFHDDAGFVIGETYTLTGERAIKYVRSRMSVGDGSNLSRMERQREFIDDFLVRLEETMESNDNLLVDAADSMSDYLVMNLTTNTISDYTTKLRTYKFNGIVTIEGEVIQGEEFAEFYPDEEDLLQKKLSVFYKGV